MKQTQSIYSLTRCETHTVPNDHVTLCLIYRMKGRNYLKYINKSYKFNEHEQMYKI